MALWQRLYLLIWFSFLELIIILPPLYPPIPGEFHIFLGLVIAGLAYYNHGTLKRAEVPGRLKRTSSATRSLCMLQIAIGVILFANKTYLWSDMLRTILLFVHLATALTVLSQASSVATGYDMWEEKEFQPAQPATT